MSVQEQNLKAQALAAFPALFGTMVVAYPVFAIHYFTAGGLSRLKLFSGNELFNALWGISTSAPNWVRIALGVLNISFWICVLAILYSMWRSLGKFKRWPVYGLWIFTLLWIVISLSGGVTPFGMVAVTIFLTVFLLPLWNEFK